MKWEQDRANNEKLAQRIGLFSSVMKNQHMRSKTIFKTLRTPRE